MVKIVNANSGISEQNLSRLFPLSHVPKHSSEHVVAIKICGRFLNFGPGKWRKRSLKVLEKSCNFFGCWCTNPDISFYESPGDQLRIYSNNLNSKFFHSFFILQISLDRDPNPDTNLFKAVQYFCGPGLDCGLDQSKAVRSTSLLIVKSACDMIMM